MVVALGSLVVALGSLVVVAWGGWLMVAAPMTSGGVTPGMSYYTTFSGGGDEDVVGPGLGVVSGGGLSLGPYGGCNNFLLAYLALAF